MEMNVTSALPRLGQLLAAALILTGTHALGQTNTATQTQAVTFSGTSGNQSVNFTGFDTSLGTLQSVTIDLTNVEVNGYATLTANATGQTIQSAYLSSGFQLQDIGDSGGTNYVTVTVQTTSAASTFNPSSVPNGSTYFVGASGTSSNGLIQVGTTPPGGFQQASSAPPTTGTPSTIATTNTGPYAGASTTVVLNLAGYNQLTTTNSGVFTTNVNDTTTADATLYYTYIAAVPEPSKTAAWMIGFALLVLVGRHYSKGRRLALA